MKKYLISVATELDGHAGSTSCYLQTKDTMSRTQFMEQLVRLFGGDKAEVSFDEYASSKARNQIGQYYGDIVTTYKHTIVRSPISALVTVLPDRMTTDKMYIIESRTG